MAIFYTDSGSFNTLEVTGSTILSGSLIISGAAQFSDGGLTGSLFGTSSVATSASYALTASYAANGGGSSSPAFPFSGSAVITGSLVVTGSALVTGSLNISRAYYDTNFAKFISKSVKLNDDRDYPLIISGSDTYDGAFRPAVIRAGVFDSTFGTTAQIELLNDGFGTKSNLYIQNNGSGDGDPNAAIYYTGSAGDLSIENQNGPLRLSANNQLILSATNVRIGNVTPASNILTIGGSVSASSYTSSLNNAVGFFGTSSWAQNAVSASYFSGSIDFPDGLTITELTASNVQLPSLTDTTAANKVLVVNTSTGKVFTTASVGTGGGGSGTGFPFSGSGVITGSLLISSSATGLALAITGSTNISGSVTSSLGFFGTSSFAISSSIAASASYVASASFGGYINFPSGLVVTGSITASAVSASFITSSHVQLNGLSDTTSANKVLVLDTTTNKIFTTASVGTGGGGSGTGFPFSGSAVITGSLLLSSSNNNSPVIISGSTDSFFELEVINFSAGNNASTDIIASSNDTTDSGNYIDLGINSTTYNAGLVGGPSDGYVYFTSSVGELHVGNASPVATGNVRLFAGGPTSDNTTRIFISSSGNVGIGTSSSLQNGLTVVGGISASLVTSSHVQLIGVTDTTATNKVLVLDTTTNKIFTTASVGTGGGGSGTGFPFSGSAIVTGSMTISGSGMQVIGNGITGSIFSGSFFNIIELTMAVSGTIAANLASNTITLDLNKANYFSVSASVAGTVSWVITNPPPTGRAQTFVIDYTNGGIKTNNWFTNTRWPGGVAPTLTSASANPDLLSFTTDDAGANWRGVLLQRGSA